MSSTRQSGATSFDKIFFGLFGVLILAVMIALARPSDDPSSGDDELLTTATSDELGEVDSSGAVESIATSLATSIPTADISQIGEPAEFGLQPELDPIIDVGEKPSHEFVRYTVERGDAPQNIADRFNIGTETLLGGNPFLSNEASLLQTGVELIILPVDGVLHTVQLGDTLESISERYGIPAEDIIAYEDNNLTFPYRLHPETQIVVPGAQPEVGFVWNPPTLASIIGRSPEALDLPVFVSGTGFHTWPVTARRLTQGYWVGHQAIDIGLPEGGAVVASDTGTVTYAAWSPYCYGNLVVINHGATGHETFYAHLSSIAVLPGQVVNKGQYLGASGNTGCSSGPHLHYEIRIFQNRDNPLFYLP